MVGGGGESNAYLKNWWKFFNLTFKFNTNVVSLAGVIFIEEQNIWKDSSFWRLLKQSFS